MCINSMSAARPSSLPPDVWSLGRRSIIRVCCDCYKSIMRRGCSGRVDWEGVWPKGGDNQTIKHTPWGKKKIKSSWVKSKSWDLIKNKPSPLWSSHRLFIQTVHFLQPISYLSFFNHFNHHWKAEWVIIFLSVSLCVCLFLNKKIKWTTRLKKKKKTSRK